MSSIAIYITDAMGVFVSTMQVDSLDPQPAGAIYAAPPALTGTVVARWRGSEWEVLPECPQPTVIALPTPAGCTRRQGRLALLACGHLAAVEAAIAAIADPTKHLAAQIEYEADTWERGNAFLQAMWADLGGTPEQFDDLFRMAVTL